jgi:hypothetical protein
MTLEVIASLTNDPAIGHRCGDLPARCRSAIMVTTPDHHLRDTIKIRPVFVRFGS